MFLRTLATLTTCLALTGAATAAVPVEIPYQGLAVGPDGQRLDGSISARFELYDAASGGSRVWDSGKLVLSADRGVVTHRLGSSAPIGIDVLRDSPALFLETTIDGATVSPRQELGAVAYSVIAAGVEDDAIDSDAIASGAVDSAEIAAGAVGASELAADSVGASELADNAVDSDALQDGSIDGPALVNRFEHQRNVTTYNATFHNTNTSSGGGLDVVGEATSTTAPALLVQAWRGSPAIWGQSFGLGNTDRVLVLQNNTWSGSPGGSYTPNTIFEVEGNGDVNIDGTFNSGGADFAEAIEVTGRAEGRTTVPGDVLVIDPTGERAVTLSAEAESSLVAGIHSTKPGITGEEPGHLLEDADTVPMAMVGIVPCKVTNAGGAIRPGDLLVTAQRPGHAMRAEDPAPGTILGKALAPCDAETGIIRVLLSLQ